MTSPITIKTFFFAHHLSYLKLNTLKDSWFLDAEYRFSSPFHLLYIRCCFLASSSPTCPLGSNPAAEGVGRRGAVDVEPRPSETTRRNDPHGQWVRNICQHGDMQISPPCPCPTVKKSFGVHPPIKEFSSTA